MVNGRRDVSEASPLVEDFLTCILLWPLFQTIVSFVENLYILVFKWVSFCLLNENKLLLMCSSCAGTSSSGLAVEYIQWAFFTTLDCINYIASFSFGCSVFGVNQLLPQCVASFEISLFLVFWEKFSWDSFWDTCNVLVIFLRAFLCTLPGVRCCLVENPFEISTDV